MQISSCDRGPRPNIDYQYCPLVGLSSIMSPPVSVDLKSCIIHWYNAEGKTMEQIHDQGPIVWYMFKIDKFFFFQLHTQTDSSHLGDPGIMIFSQVFLEL